MSHKCPYDDCTTETDLTKFMCPKHWRFVPRSIGMKIVNTFKRYQNAKTDLQRAGEYKLLRQYQNQALEELGCQNRVAL